MSTVQQPPPVFMAHQPAQGITAPHAIQVSGQSAGPIMSTAVDPRMKHKTTLYRLGVTEIVIGSLCIIFAIIPMAMTSSELDSFWTREYYPYGRYRINTSFTYAASGIWSGIFVITTGILGVRIRGNPSKCNYIANMILSILTANISFTAAVVSGIAAGLSYFSGALIAMNAILSLLNITAMIISITHAAFCCGGACYGNNSGTNQQVIYVPAQPNAGFQQPQYVQSPNGQWMMVPGQSVMSQPQPIQAINPGYPTASYYPMQQAAQPGAYSNQPSDAEPQNKALVST